MCLIVLAGRASREILKEDLTVYKLSLYRNKKLVSIIREYEYKPEELQPEVELILQSDYSGCVRTISKGYHAFLSIDGCYESDILRRDVICEFVIPKGSEVYYGMDNQIVSNQIKFIKPLKQINDPNEERTIPDEFTPFSTDNVKDEY
jgi:hypothetical protein